jgi:glycosyltransferase involved in cell wall biosynthesis
VSVLVPVHNQARFLPEAVRSILAQDLEGIEVIVVDDGSDDGSAELCDAFAREDDRVRVIHQEHRGVASARNAALDAARGEWVAFMDSDDIVGPSHLRTLLDAATAQGTDIAIGSVVRFETDALPSVATSAEGIRIASGREVCSAIYEEQGFVFDALWAKIYRRELFEGIRFPEGKTREDAFVAHELLYPQARIALCPNCPYGYRKNPDGIMAKPLGAQTFDAMDALEARIAYYERAGDTELAEKTRSYQQLWRAIFVAQLLVANAGDAIPKRWRMETGDVLSWLSANLHVGGVGRLLNQLLTQIRQEG